MEHFIRKPFAVEGDRAEVPVNLSPTGKVSFATGYSFDYERDSENDPQAKNIERREFNELMYIVTSAIRQYQTQGVPPYITPEDNGGNPFAYAKKARCLFDGGSGQDVYVSLADNNTSTPADSQKWRREDVLDYVQGTRKITTVAPLKGGGTLDTDLSLSLDSSVFAASNRKISVTAPLTGGGTLDGDVSIGMNATAAPTANAVIVRDSAGRAKVAAPAAADDIARKAETDAAALKAAWTTVTGKPATFAPSAHTHPVAQVTGVLPLANGGTARTDGAAPKLVTARTIALTGAITGTATAFDGTKNINIATTATAASLGFTQKLAATGWCKMPNGLILQWGTVVIPKDSLKAVTFPVAFPTACIFADAAGVYSDVGGGTNQPATTIPIRTKTGITIANDVGQCENLWLAIGY